MAKHVLYGHASFSYADGKLISFISRPRAYHGTAAQRHALVKWMHYEVFYMVDKLLKEYNMRTLGYDAIEYQGEPDMHGYGIAFGYTRNPNGSLNKSSISVYVSKD